MAIFRRLKIAQPVSDRQPDKTSLLIWAQREVVLILRQLRKVVNWAVDWLGYVGIDLTDTPGLLPDKLKVDSTMTETVGGPEGSRTLTLGASAAGVVNLITENTTEVTNLTNSVVNEITNVSTNPTYITQIIGALPTPATVESTLYTAMVPDPRNHGQVVCCFLGPHIKGTNTPMVGSGGWTAIAPGVLQYPHVGLIPSYWLDGVDPTPAYGHVSSLIGKTVMVYYQGDTSVLGDEEPLQGPYVIDDVGANWVHVDGDPPDKLRLVSSFPRMHRAPDYSISSQFVQNMTFQTQTGNTYGASFITLTNASVVLGTTALTWDFTAGPTFAWTQQYRLLTGPQLISDGASNETLELVATTDVTIAGGDIVLQESFETLIGTPGLDALPAGIWKSDNEEVYLEAPGSPGSITTLRWVIRNGAGTVLFTMESPPISTTTPTALSFQYLDAGHSFSPTDYLEAVPWLHTTSTTPVTFHLRYSSPGHGTRFTVPFALPITGAATGRHPDLSGRELAEQHPRFAITDVIGTATIAGSGTLTRLVLAAPYRSGEITPTGAVVIYGVDPTDWSDGQEFVLFVDGLRPDGSPVLEFTFVHLHGNSDGSDVYVGVDLETGDGQNATYTRPVVLRLKRRARLNRWQLVEATM
jgi:hypothetical protein